MNTVIIYFVLFASFRELLSTISEPSAKTILYKCNSEKEFHSNCTFDGSSVEILKYSCDSKYPDFHIGPLVYSEKHFNGKLPSLRTLDISDLGIVNIFIKCDVQENHYAAITTLNASHNEFNHSSNIFNKCMPNLSQIDFAYNNMSFVSFEGFVATALKQVNFSHNRIEEVKHFKFLKLQQLEHLDLSNNQINSLGKKTFEKNSNLKWLSLRNNPLSHFNFNMFPESITSITVHLPSENIKSLNVSCHDAPCLFKGFENEDNYEKIETFNASGNHFENLSEVPNKLGQNLSVLDLSYCSGQAFNMQKLRKFTALKEVYLSYDNLADEHTRMFSKGFPCLETLDLQGNSFHQLDDVTPDKFPKMKWLAISKNQLHCDDLKEFLKKWTTKSLHFINSLTKGADQVNGIDCHRNDLRRVQATTPGIEKDVILTEYPKMAIIMIVTCLALALISVSALLAFRYYRYQISANTKNEVAENTGHSFEQELVTSVQENDSTGGQDGANELLYEEMYMSQEQLQLNIMRQVRFLLFGTNYPVHSNQIGFSNPENRLNCPLSVPDYPGRSNRNSWPNSPNILENSNNLENHNEQYDHLEF